MQERGGRGCPRVSDGGGEAGEGEISRRRRLENKGSEAAGEGGGGGGVVRTEMKREGRGGREEAGSFLTATGGGAHPQLIIPSCLHLPTACGRSLGIREATGPLIGCFRGSKLGQEVMTDDLFFFFIKQFDDQSSVLFFFFFSPVPEIINTAVIKSTLSRQTVSQGFTLV